MILELLGAGAVLLLLAVAALVVTYFASPETVWNWGRDALRRRARLTEVRIAVDGHEWPCLVGGPADGEPLLMIHGFGGDKDNWTGYARHFTDDYRVIAPDLPGFGDNDRSPERSYAVPEQLPRITAFLDALGVERAHVTGNSMGGMIALGLALEHPERVRTLTLVNSAGVRGESKSELEEQAEAGENSLVPRTVADVRRLARFVVHRPPPFVPARFAQLLLDKALPHQESLDATFWALVRQIEERAYNDRLGELSMPVLVVWGRQDRLIDVSVVEEFRRAVPQAEIAVFEETGHVPMIERPRAMARAQRAFLAKAAAG